MSKGKPRHNPNKRANNYGAICSYYEDGAPICELGLYSTKCKGNRHNCVKVQYQKYATL